MKWNYRCLICNDWRNIKWEDRKKTHKCHKNGKSYVVPIPNDQHDAYVNTHNWPKEMEDAVIKGKEKICTVPGCNKNYETLDHRIPYSMSGNTSVENLFPMCNNHNKSKGDKDYETWLQSKGN